MTRLRLTAAVAALLASAPAFAGPYLGANGNMTSSEFKDVKESFGYSAYGGFQLDDLKFPLFVEAEYYDSGKVKVKDAEGGHLRYSGPMFYAGGALKVGNHDSLVFFKAGYHRLKGETIIEGEDGAKFSETKGNFTLGIGGDWMFSPQVGMRFAIETPMKVDSFPGISEDVADAVGFNKKDVQLSVFQIGLVWRPKFGAGSGSRPAPVDRPYDVPAPVTTASATSAPAPYVAPAPKMVTPLSSGMSATLRAGTTLKAQPRPDAPVAGSVTKDSTVTLTGNSQQYGEWWFVRGSELMGWVPASEIPAP